MIQKIIGTVRKHVSHGPQRACSCGSGRLVHSMVKNWETGKLVRETWKCHTCCTTFDITW